MLFLHPFIRFARNLSNSFCTELVQFILHGNCPVCSARKLSHLFCTEIVQFVFQAVGSKLIKRQIIQFQTSKSRCSCWKHALSNDLLNWSTDGSKRSMKVTLIECVHVGCALRCFISVRKNLCVFCIPWLPMKTSLSQFRCCLNSWASLCILHAECRLNRGRWWNFPDNSSLLAGDYALEIVPVHNPLG